MSNYISRRCKKFKISKEEHTLDLFVSKTLPLQTIGCKFGHQPFTLPHCFGLRLFCSAIFNGRKKLFHIFIKSDSYIHSKSVFRFSVSAKCQWIWNQEHLKSEIFFLKDLGLFFKTFQHLFNFISKLDITELIVFASQKIFLYQMHHRSSKMQNRYKLSSNTRTDVHKKPISSQSEQSWGDMSL